MGLGAEGCLAATAGRDSSGNSPSRISNFVQ